MRTARVSLFFLFPQNQRDGGEQRERREARGASAASAAFGRGLGRVGRERHPLELVGDAAEEVRYRGAVYVVADYYVSAAVAYRGPSRRRGYPAVRVKLIVRAVAYGLRRVVRPFERD